jgi:signal transduction histidine kinase
MFGEAAGGARILVVDSDRASREFVCARLRQHGYLVSGTATGGGALTCTATQAPDLILLDVLLPDADGFSVCRQLKGAVESRDIPVVFLSAKNDGPGVVQGFEAGGVDYICKPFDVAVLLARVKTHATLSRLSRGLQQTLDERTARLKEANRRLRDLNVEMARVEERQRRRLAEELHDTTIQQLALARVLIDGDGDLNRRRPQLDELLGDSLRQLRTLVFELSPPVLHQAGLFPAIEWLAERIAAQWGLTVDCERRGDACDLPEVLSLILFQGTRELLINVVKHAEANRVQVRLGCDGSCVEVVVTDDGRGFNAASALFGTGDDHVGIRGGFGLSCLRSRIELLGGRFEIESQAAAGSQVRLRVPLGQYPSERRCS